MIEANKALLVLSRSRGSTGDANLAAHNRRIGFLAVSQKFAVRAAQARVVCEIGAFVDRRSLNRDQNEKILIAFPSNSFQALSILFLKIF